MYELTTNHGTFYVKLMPSMEQIAAYYTRERQNGTAIPGIIFKVREIKPIPFEIILNMSPK